tara:strand:+ start:803 stop:1135 length:333 start_codon:yes stop_codon:yes gene_type:complete
MANKYINKSINLTTTDLTIIYTVPAETVAIVKAIQAFNDTASSVNVTLSYTDTSASATYVFGYATSTAIEQFELLTSDLLVLEESDILKIQATAANQITGVVSILEQDRT